jgi:hypothetical protein
MSSMKTLLESLAHDARARRRQLREFAHGVTDSASCREDKMRALVDEMHRRFVFSIDPTVRETVGPFTTGSLDADDACTFLAAAAMSVGIRCRIVGARYGSSWTCWIQYENENGAWETIDPLRQKKPDREPDECAESDCSS